ncbi:MAG: CBS domain-containing protein [Bacteroidota bacterium]
MKVKNILDSKGRKVFSVKESATVEHIVSLLAANKVGFLVVLNDIGEVSGVISERDVVHRCMSVKKDPVQLKASEIMTPRASLSVASEEEEIESIMSTMTEKKIRHLPIFKGEELVGLISIGDVIKFILEEKNEEIKSLMDYVSR